MAFSTEPSVSVIILAYNEELYIRECIEAVLDQSVQPLEIVVVDNNSTDSTMNIALEYDLVRVVQEPVQGVVAARTRGFNEARGEILVKIDADTIVGPGWLETMQKIFSKDSSLDAASGWFENQEKSPEFIKKISLFVSNHFVFNFHSSFGTYRMIFGSNLWIRRCSWEKITPFLNPSNDIWEDLDIALCLNRCNLNNIYIHKTPLYSISARRLRQSTREAVLYGLGGYRTLKPYSLWRATVLACITTVGAFLSLLIKITLVLSKEELLAFGENAQKAEE